ncbi:nuclear envelope phosphatase-regulatory subunit 1 isoform X1 [Ambystoma mexicanum]|uniref:nuclear envelope phosphatase-regulatory subunit 1 isoform X1 n=1 Tax=Ambystoma mexicanum TaxID=8296 RepID=UPI0037E7ED90
MWGLAQCVLGGTDMNSLEQAEDLKAFERRLTEYISCLQPATGRWRMLLIVVSVCTATGAWNWLIDPETQKVSFFTSLWNHPFFTISCITLIDGEAYFKAKASRPVTILNWLSSNTTMGSRIVYSQPVKKHQFLMGLCFSVACE